MNKTRLSVLMAMLLAGTALSYALSPHPPLPPLSPQSDLSKDNANCTVQFHGMTVSGHDGSLRMWRSSGIRPVASTAVAGLVTGIAVRNDSILMAVTSNSLIYLSLNGTEWTMMDFVSTYADYYGQVDIRGVAASDHDFMIFGADEQGMPVAFTSAQGQVWSPRPLEYQREGVFERLQTMPAGITHNSGHDRYELCLGNGDRLLLPACSHCNALLPAAGSIPAVD